MQVCKALMHTQHTRVHYTFMTPLPIGVPTAGKMLIDN